METRHDRAVILSTGDEIITGQLQDTNARWLAQRLVERGIVPVEHGVVPDDLGALVSAIRRACAAAPLVVMSGGLGPTEGDLTRRALGEVMGDQLVEDAAAHRAIAALLARRGRAMSERQARQAQRPSRAVCLPNAVGTAPGLHARVMTQGAEGERWADVVCLPGPPGELRPMFASGVEGLLRPASGRSVLTRLCHIVGLGEAECVERLGALTARDRVPLVGITASGGVLTLRIRYEGPGDAEVARRSVDATEKEARRVLGEHLFATGENTASAGMGVGLAQLAMKVIGLLAERGETLCVVESCTGGMLGEVVTSQPGASAAFVGGSITYANGEKIRLGVDAGVIERHGAVSRECCGEMARAGVRRHGAAHAIAITGVAGPDGGSDAKPVGTVYVGVASAAGRAARSSRAGAGPDGSACERLDVRGFRFTGDREDIRRRACTTGLAMLYFALCGRVGGEPALLWEVPEDSARGASGARGG